MKNLISNFKTQDRMTILFTFFSFLSLIILLVGVNVIYFFAWYSDQKEESMYDMNVNYSMYLSSQNDNNLEAFKEYILQKDTLIIPNNGGDLICSNGVETRVHNDIDKIKDKLFYNNGEKTFFIFSRTYDEIGEVKVFFDTTPYVKSQIMITKISLLIIMFLIIIYYFIIKLITSRALKNSKQFITDISHEFKTPLMVINSEIDLYKKKLERNKLKEKDTNILLKKIKDKTSKLDNLIETFLLLSRLGSSVQTLNKEEVDIEKYIKKLTDDFLGDNEKSIIIDYKLEKDLKVNIEKNTFTIIFENLLSNAIKFSEEGGKIEIGLNKNRLWVKDNGVGMKKSDLKKIWKKFHRNDNKKEGFGVGLFIVKRLVKLYNWRIKVESEEGVGSKFEIKF